MTDDRPEVQRARAILGVPAGRQRDGSLDDELDGLRDFD